MNIETAMGYLAMLFGVLGSIGLYRQAKLIWRGKSAESVSGVWVITFLAMFVAFLVYGTQKHSFPMEFQGWLRVAFSLPVTVGFFVFGKVNKKHLSLIALYAVLLAGMSHSVLSPWLFTLFSFLGIWSSFVQAYTIKAKRSRGKVAVELQTIYLLAVVCWLVYSVVRHDVPLFTVSAGFILSYSSTIVMWKKYPNL